MLTALSIRDFVSIERLDLDAGPGLTVLTGETGAGKSILLEALALALGAPAERRFVRTGCDLASVTAEFALAPAHPVFAALEAAGLSVDRADALSLRRAIRASGPSRTFLNDQPVSAGLMAAIAPMLVEIHAQHAQAELLDPARHRDWLDQYAGNEGLLAETARAWRTREAALAELAAAEARAREADEAAEALRAALAEWRALQPLPGEFAALSADKARLSGLARAADALEEARGLIGPGLEAALAGAARALSRAARLETPSEGAEGGGFAGQAERVERALIDLQDLATELDAQLGDLSEARARLEAIDSRLFALKTAARRHRCPPEMLAEQAEACESALAALEAGETGLSDLRRRAQASLEAWEAAACALRAARERAGARLGEAVARELAPLRLERARFRVSVGEGRDGPSGRDSVAFEIATAPAAPFSPLDRTASGGELSRIALALRVALAETGAAGTLIFDEIDQGVGGAVAAAIGERLRRLAQRRQVLAVTHSPQVAASGAAHWRLEKAFDASGLGLTRLAILDRRAREEEIARMLAGREVTGEARAAAERLLESGQIVESGGARG